MTGWLVAAGVVLVVGYCGLIGLVDVFGAWSIRHQEAREAAATFIDDYIPEAADVSPAELATDAMLSQIRADAIFEAAWRVALAQDMCDLLESAIAHVDGGWVS